MQGVKRKLKYGHYYVKKKYLQVIVYMNTIQ